MRSIGAGGVTVVSIITLVFAQVGHGRHLEQVGKSTPTVAVPCRAHTPCPVQRTVTNRIVLPERSDGRRGGDDGRTAAVAATTTAAAGAP
jgi:hypothetical protein